jgi:hypothetical protein
MLTPQALERVSSYYRRGYYAGYRGEGPEPFSDPTTFSAFDYHEGYKAGTNDARWDNARRSDKRGRQ